MFGTYKYSRLYRREITQISYSGPVSGRIPNFFSYHFSNTGLRLNAWQSLNEFAKKFPFIGSSFLNS